MKDDPVPVTPDLETAWQAYYQDSEYETPDLRASLADRTVVGWSARDVARRLVRVVEAVRGRLTAQHSEASE